MFPNVCFSDTSTKYVAPYFTVYLQATVVSIGPRFSKVKAAVAEGYNRPQNRHHKEQDFSGKMNQTVEYQSVSGVLK